MNEQRKKKYPLILLYDGKCPFCVRSMEKLRAMDFFSVLNYVDLHKTEDLKTLHPELTKELALRQLHLIEPSGKLYGGFYVFRRICFFMPMLYPLIPLMYFPGMGGLGSFVYRWIAKNRYLFHFNHRCRDNACFVKEKK